MLAGAVALLALGAGAGTLRARARAADALASPLYARPVAVRPHAAYELPPRGAAGQVEVTRAALLLRIGGDERDGGFGRVADAAPSLTGDTLFVLDAMQGTVAAFGPDGGLLYRFGSKGAGPGQFRRPAQLLVLPWSGAPAVWDEEAQRLTVHGPDGAVLRTLPLHAAGRRTRSRTIRRVAAFGGGFVLEVHPDPLLDDARAPRGALLRVDTAGAGADTLLRFAVAAAPATHRETANGSSATTWLDPPVFSPAARWDLLADGTVLFAPGGPAEAYRVDPGGRVTRIRWPHRHRPVSRRDRLRRLAGERERGLLASPGTSLLLLERLNRGFFAAVRPAVTGLLASPRGEVWTRRFDTGDGWEGHARTWDRAGADGAPLPSLVLPADFRPLRVVGERLYGVARDALDVERVEVYRLPGEER